ncbi:hypothetical protein [Rubricoccus marinus]|uniref:hypothetical protein n=1 Tax=Rubricoccus marinus TaxID=716817 RepID=UPI0011799444|nr:hypothetical protein [Rubricoccus marinus]
MTRRALRFFLPLATAVLCSIGAQAQDIPEGPGLGAERDTVEVQAGAGFLQLRGPIAPRSVRVDVIAPEARTLEPGAYLVDLASGAFRLVAPFDTLTTLVIAYRTLPRVVAPAPLPRFEEPETDSTGRQRPPPRTGASGASTVTTSGSITRGVVAGSNRDVSLTSGLRLDIGGEIAPGVTVSGALTDSDTPIVPEGTTQTLSDFDRVFVRVDGPGAAARLGDIDLALDGTSFAPIRRKVQGAALSVNVPARGWISGGRVEAGASAVRGRFRSQDLLLIEGVQGPYRLEGDRGEPFVLVVPGSERLYWDGRPLARGRDYTVDYGTGEVTFTAENLVTAERRATVDFEYSAGGYARTLSVAGASLDFGRSPAASGASGPLGTFGIRVLREADAPGLGDALGLSETDLDLIAAAGDRDVLVPGETRVPFDPESATLLYTARDTTLASGETVRIFVPASASADSVFRVRFSRVRQGQGTYRRAGQALNGILYEYAGPSGGDYVPFRILPRPASRTVLDVRASAEPLAGLTAFGELARSLDDANTLSDLDAADDGATAYETGLRFAPEAYAWGTVEASLLRRDRARDFRTLDRVRAIDYNRRWNLARAGTPFEASIDSLGETLTEGLARVTARGLGTVGLEAGKVALGAYRARRAGLTAGLLPDARDLPLASYALDAVDSSGDDPLLGSGSFFRQRLGLQRALLGGRLTPSLGLEQETREQIGGALPQDSLLAATYSFVAVQPGLAYTSRGLSASGQLDLRQESEPLAPAGTAEDLADAARSLGIEGTLRVQGAAGFRSDLRAAFRQRQFTDAFRERGRLDTESLALDWTARAAPLARGLDVRTRYVALTERTPVLQEAYVLVGPEAGLYVWRDGQGEPRAGEPDGRQQVDEFFPETTPYEGSYLRTFVPSDELVPSVGVDAQLALRMDGARLAERYGATLLRHLDARGSAEVREKTASGGLLRVLLLDPGVLQQRPDGDAVGTLDGRFRAEGEVSLFPRDARRGLRLGGDHLTTTRRLAAGAEARLTQSLRAEGRLALGPAFLARLTLRTERRRATSTAFATRTFDIGALTLEPSVTWTPSPEATVTLGAFASTRTDRLATATAPDGALLVRVPADARWAPSRRVSLTARAELSVVSLRGASGGGLALYELTDGRGAGTSALGGVQATLGVTEAIRATVTYDARLPASAPLVQTVRVTLSAVF